jgi:hypothetical protein
MSRFMTGLVLGVLLAALPAIAADAPEAAMPPAAAGILAQMDKEIVLAKTKAVASLDKVLKDTTKKGDLAGAVAIKEQIDQLKAEAQTASGARPGGGRVNANAIVGSWHDGANNVDILPDGSCSSSGKTARWRMDGNAVEMKWEFGQTYRLTLTPEGLVGVSVTSAGKELGQVRLTRLK